MLEKTYIEYIKSDIDDSRAIKELKSVLENRNVVVIVPGSSATRETNQIKEYIKEKDAILVSVNFVHDLIDSDYVYMSNTRRYSVMKQNKRVENCKKIITSNIKIEPDQNEMIISFNELVKCGWNNLDNSTIMLLRLLDRFDVKTIAIAGFDGYDLDVTPNYASDNLELSNVRNNPIELNEEIASMLEDYKKTRKYNVPIEFIAQSRFSKIFEKGSFYD